MQSGGLNSALSPVVYGDIALSIKINTQIYTHKYTNAKSVKIQRKSCHIFIALYPSTR